MSESNATQFELFGDTPVTSLNQQNVDPLDYKVLQRIPICPKTNLDLEHLAAQLPFSLPLTFNEPQPQDQPATLILLDTETTGLDQYHDEIIELGMCKVSYSKNRNCLLRLEDIFDELNEPKHEITPQITELTGITNAELKGKTFNRTRIQSFFHDANLILAHNARFDRPFFEKSFPELTDLNWACTLQEIDWQHSLNMPSSKLSLMVRELGFFFEAHRAVSDCLALLWLLHITTEISADKSIAAGSFAQLLEKARQATCDLRFTGNNTYDIKDELKEKFHARYRDRAWYLTDLREAELQKIELYTEEKIASGIDVGYEIISKKTARDRYKL